VTPDQYLRTSVQKSCFVLSHSACVVLDISLRKYRVGHADLIPGGGIAQLKPAVLSVVARLRHGLSAAGNCFLSIRFAAAQRTGLRSSPIEERKSKLAALLQRPPADVRYSASFTQNIDELLSRVRELSLEGLIGKRAGSKYDSKRSGAWIKIKLYQQGSFVIGGYTQPAGERKHIGALLVGVNENGKLKFAGRVGTGFSEKLLKTLSLELNKIAVKSCPFFNLLQPVADWIRVNRRRNEALYLG